MSRSNTIRLKNELRRHKTKGFRYSAGKTRNATGALNYPRFWLGHDEDVARQLAKVIDVEWSLLSVHGGDVWTAEALARIDRSKRVLNGEFPDTVLIEAAPVTAAATAPVSQVAAAPVAAPAPPTTESIDDDEQPTAGEFMLHDAIDEFRKANFRSAEAGQLSAERALVISHTLRRLERAVADVPMRQIDFKAIRAIVEHFAARPVSKYTKKKLAPDTVIDTIYFTRQMFAYFAASKQWTAPADMDVLFAYKRKNLYTEAELDRKETVVTFTIDELGILWEVLFDLPLLCFLLALNCGFTQREISTLRRADCHLDTDKPYISRRRHKTAVRGKWRLWPETAKGLQKLMAGENEGDLALLRKDGKPVLYYDEFFAKNDTVRHDWNQALDEAAELHAHHKRYDERPADQRPKDYRKTVAVRRLGFKYLRKTGADMIRRIAGKEIAEIYLAHADPTMARKYTNPDFKRLARALRKMREQLIPVLGPLPEPAPAEEVASAATV